MHYNPVHDTSLYIKVPGRIEAEDYSTMSGIAVEGTSDFDGIANVGWIDAGDWLEYNLNVPDSGDYFIYLRFAATASSSVNVLANDSLKTIVNLTNTGGWQSWRTIKSQVVLDSGRVKLRLHTPKGSFNINWLRISTQDNSSPLCSAGEDQEIITPENSILLTGQGSDPDDDSLVFRWSQVSGAPCLIESPGKAVTNVLGLIPGNYYFRLEVSDAYEVSSDLVRITVKQNTVGSSPLISNKLEIYPNPVSNMLMLSIPENFIPDKLTITNIMGQVVLKPTIAQDEEYIQWMSVGLILESIW